MGTQLAPGSGLTIEPWLNKGSGSDWTQPILSPRAIVPTSHMEREVEGDILTEDDVYCSCLAKTLCHVPVPVTVGFYAPFGCRLHMMLDKITALAHGLAPTDT
ncbi:hypothetical protein TREES_T100011445 [Tupaia chinensis]|uniref:Uncharacterized protein n=1 Tax=Tupaia chinensis TaxID=246437 RepID=L9LBI5_TUPCH|nr:hypothetical protein TREES_T100011445 [Tupaia chinensis]